MIVHHLMFFGCAHGII